MAYYDRKNSKLDERNMEYLDSGGFANIYFDGEKILKVYHLDSLNPFQGKITLEVFDLLKEDQTDENRVIETQQKGT